MAVELCFVTGAGSLCCRTHFSNYSSSFVIVILVIAVVFSCLFTSFSSYSSSFMIVILVITDVFPASLLTQWY